MQCMLQVIGERSSWGECVPAAYERSSWADSAPLPYDRGSSGDKGQGQGQGMPISSDEKAHYKDK